MTQRAGNTPPNPSLGAGGGPNLARRLERHIQGKTISGLMELFPLLVTILVVTVIIGYADSFVHPMIKHIPWQPPFLGSLTFTGVGLIILAVLFYLTGLAVSSRLGRRSFNTTGKILNATPVVGSIYGLTQTVAAVMSSQYRFSRVVFLEWPRDDMIALGFVTGRAVSPSTGESLVVVYIPTVPNPTSGNMAIVVEDDVYETDLTVEDAMKMVFSGGIVLPESFAFARLPREKGTHEFVGRFDSVN